MNALKIGAVQMLAPSLSKLGGDFEAFDLPFLFKDHAAYRRVVDSPIGAELLAKLNERGFKGLAYWDNGFKVFTANRSLESVKDFKGLKIRVQASRALVNQMEVLGSEASISPLINVYEALRSGKLDGQENTPINITSQRINEVQSHLTVSNHGYLAYAVIVNKVFWEKLPADIRQILEEAMREATRFANSIAEQENNKATERMAANPRLHIYRLSPQEAETWRKAMDPVYVKTQAWISPDLLRSIRQVSGAPP
jgi:C4-dicarboxylate-binding protein DctP